MSQGKFTKQDKEEYWLEVKKIMIETHGKTVEHTDECIRLLRANYKKAKVGLIQYHDSVENTAEALAGWTDKSIDFIKSPHKYI